MGTAKTKSKVDPALLTPPEVALVPVGKLHPSPKPNSNKMEPAEFDLLVAGMKAFGCVQPLLVRPRPEAKPAAAEYEIVDGQHRWRAAKQAGLAKVLVVVAHTDDQVSALLGLSLNRLRGETDLTVASEVLVELASLGWSLDKLSLSGFQPDELSGLLQAHGGEVDLLASAANMELPSMSDSPKPKKPALRLEFASKGEMDLVVAMALDHGPTVEAGLLCMAKEVS